MKSELSQQLGQRLREARRLSGLSQDQVGAALGMGAAGSKSYVSRLEQGKIPKVAFVTLVRYLQACKVPVGRFMLELAQSGAFGEAEVGLSTDYTDRGRIETEKRAKARLRHEQQREREAQDAAIIAKLWLEVQAAILPLLPSDPSRRHMFPYLQGVRAFYRAWKRLVRGALGKGPTLDVQMAFDRIEQAGVQVLVPAALRKMREIVFDRLIAMTPQGGNTQNLSPKS